MTVYQIRISLRSRTGATPICSSDVFNQITRKLCTSTSDSNLIVLLFTVSSCIHCIYVCTPLAYTTCVYSSHLHCVCVCVCVCVYSSAYTACVCTPHAYTACVCTPLTYTACVCTPLAYTACVCTTLAYTACVCTPLASVS